MTQDELLKRKMTARQERDFHLQQAGVALGIEMECDRILAESNGNLTALPSIPTEAPKPEAPKPRLVKKDAKPSPDA